MKNTTRIFVVAVFVLSVCIIVFSSSRHSEETAIPHSSVVALPTPPVPTQPLPITTGPIVLPPLSLPTVPLPVIPDISPGTRSIYWGAYVNYDNSYLPQEIDTFEAHAGKHVSIIHRYIAWGSTYNTFSSNTLYAIRNTGSIPLVTWEPWNYKKSDSVYSLDRIIDGDFDTYITAWAQSALAWKHPFFLRFAHEMNGDWYPWSEQTNGNSAGEYVLAWHHIHDIFENVASRAGTPTNITWVWCPNSIYNTASGDLARYYPGDAYVDWVCIDGYNMPGTETSFADLFTHTYTYLRTLAPAKPIMIAETSSYQTAGTGVPHHKALWITDALQVQLPVHFPHIKAIVWFNTNKEKDWRIESSPESEKAFRESIASDYYASDMFGDLPDYMKIRPIR